MNYKVKFIVRLLFHFPPKFWVKVVDTTQKITKPTEIHFVYLAITNLQLIATKSVLLNLHISLQILVKDIKQNKLLYFSSRKNNHYFVISSAVTVIWFWTKDLKVLLKQRATNNRG